MITITLIIHNQHNQVVYSQEGTPGFEVSRFYSFMYHLFKQSQAWKEKIIQQCSKITLPVSDLTCDYFHEVWIEGFPVYVDQNVNRHVEVFLVPEIIMDQCLVCICTPRDSPHPGPVEPVFSKFSFCRVQYSLPRINGFFPGHYTCLFFLIAHNIYNTSSHKTCYPYN